MVDKIGEHPLFEPEEPVVKNEKPINHNRGFRTLTAEKRKAVASEGGKAAHAIGTAHRWTREEAREAGRKGGKINRRRKKKI